MIQLIDFIRSIPAIAMEFAEGGNLDDFLNKQNEPVNKVLRYKWAMQLTDAVAYLHWQGIVHSKYIFNYLHFGFTHFSFFI